MGTSLRRTLQGKSALITGHTGFKGSWLCLWLHRLGVKVIGYALDPPTEPSHFAAARVRSVLSDDLRADVRDVDRLTDVMRETQPDLVMHLAAQSVVREGYRDPWETFSVNAMGTAGVLEAVRRSELRTSLLVVTSDKCYENREQPWGYRENDPLGDKDPYGGSKGAAELVVRSYLHSFFPPQRVAEHGVKLATARAGNVIGGGDWTPYALVTDVLSAIREGREATLHNPAAVRPWQHVLQALSGYLLLSARLLDDATGEFCGGWNFGPLPGGELPVACFARKFLEQWGDGTWGIVHGRRPQREAQILRLAIDKAIHDLGWRPCWDVQRTIAETVAWYQRWFQADVDMQQFAFDQIDAYHEALHEAGIVDDGPARRSSADGAGAESAAAAIAASASALRFAESNRLRLRAHRLIPGGCHTYAKGDDQYPRESPGFVVRGKGAHVWDADGNRFIEYGQGNRAVTLGHAYEPVLAAVRRELAYGSNFTRPAPIEVEAAEALLGVLPSAEMVKFCKDGSDATTAAIKLARAATGRDYVACCRDHPFFATNDWFIGTTPLDAGIPHGVKDLTLTFGFNDLPGVERLFSAYPGQIAGLILEPAKYEDPADGFLHAVGRLCHQHGALLIIDEMITGFRWHVGGGQAYYGIEPDLSCFGKALANGFSVSALAGKRRYMELGGLLHEGPRVFLLSTTHGGETHALAAAIETIATYRREPVIDSLDRLGRRLRAGCAQAIERHGLQDHVQIEGKPCCLAYSTRDERGDRSQAFRSLLLQETIRRGVLMTTLVVGYAHTDEDIDRTVDAFDGALGVYCQALDGGVERFLIGEPTDVVYRSRNFAEGARGVGAVPRPLEVAGGARSIE